MRTTSMLAVTVTFERLLLAKTSGAVLFGVVNAFVPILLALPVADLPPIDWATLAPAIVRIAVSSTVMGLFIAVSLSEVLEAQTFSNLFRFPMVFLCGLFLPIERPPTWLQPLSYVLPLTYGADLLHGAVHQGGVMSPALSFGALAAACAGLFALSLRHVRRRWIG